MQIQVNAWRYAMRGTFLKALTVFWLIGISAALYLVRPRPVTGGAMRTGPEHVLSFPYYSIKGDWDSTLTLNNSSVNELAATVTLYSLDGESLRPSSLNLKPNSNIAVLLSELLSRSSRIDQFLEGSIDVRFNSDDPMAIAPQLTVSDSQNGLSFDMEPAMMPMSSTLEGLWWSPDKKTNGQVMLSNTTEHNLEALINVQWRGVPIPAPVVTLSAHQTTVLSIESLLRSINIEVEGIERGGLSITHNGMPGAVVAHGVIQNKETHFASNLPFLDPTMQKNSVLNGTGLMLGHPAPGSAFPESSFFTPRLALKNSLKAAQTATVSVRYMAQGQETARVKNLPIVNLAPSEVRMVDFSALMFGLRNVSINAAELRIESSGARGSLIAALSSVDESRSVEIDVPLVSRSERSGEGGNHPFLVGETFRSIAYLTNITQKPTKVAVIIFHEAGMYTPELISVPAGATLAIDLLQLRDSQAKDIQGRALPEDLTQGQFFWHPHQGEALIGRIVTFDKAIGTASNFSCPNCCQQELSGLEILPSPIAGQVGEFCQLTVNEYESYCGQYAVGPYNYTNLVAYSCDNTSIATVNSGGGVSCVGLGNATITISLDYWHSDNVSAEDCGLFLLTTTSTAPVAVKPNISSISPARGVQGIAYGVTITGTGFRSPASVSVAGTGVGVSEVAVGSSTEILATFTVAADATAGNHHVTVTVSGQTSNHVNFYVQIPTTIRQDSIDVITTCDPTHCTIGTQQNACGAYRFVHYTLVDQANPAQPIAEMATVTETVKDLSVPNDPGTTKNVSTNEAGAFNDLLALFKFNTCPSVGESASFSQTFAVQVGSETFTLTRVNRIDYMKSSSGQYSISITVQTP